VIGIIASILTAVLTGNYLPLLTPLIYVISLKSKNIALFAFYIYILMLAFSFNPGSIYTLNGMNSILVTLSVIIVLDEILRGFELRLPSKEEFILLGALTVSAITLYTFLPVLTAVTFYTAYRRFGKASFYVIGWWVLVIVFLYAAKNQLIHTGAQALVIIGLALVLILVGERKDVKPIDVKLIKKP